MTTEELERLKAGALEKGLSLESAHLALAEYTEALERKAIQPKRGAKK